MKMQLVDPERGSNCGSSDIATQRQATGRVSVAPKASNAYTMKIVLTMTVAAGNRDQAEALASHVAAFMPEDAERVAEAFSPIISVPQEMAGRGKKSPHKPPMATASVILVTNETPEPLAAREKGESMVPTSNRSIQSTRLDHSSVRASLRSTASVIAPPPRGRRTSLITRGSV